MAESSNSKIHERKARQIHHHKDLCCINCCNTLGFKCMAQDGFIQVQEAAIRNLCGEFVY